MDRQEKGKKLIKALSDEGFDPRSYSGRGMFGVECVSIHVDRDDGPTLWELAQALIEHPIPEPNSDQLGLGHVYYWPSYHWPSDGPQKDDL